MDETIAQKLLNLKALVLDVDGVMTDGKVIIADDGKESKSFHVRDGHGLRLLIRGGVEVMFLTGRFSELLKVRARELEVTEVHQKVLDKLATFTEIAARKGLSFAEVAFVGDDVIDVPLLKRVAFSATPADASEDVKAVVDYVSTKKGGEGMVREICEMILKAKGLWRDVIAKYDL